MINVGFYIRHFDYRGTADAIFNYAHYNETLLGNKSYFIYHDPPLAEPYENANSRKRFEDRFTILIYRSKVEFENLCLQYKIALVYQLIPGFESDAQFFAEHYPDWIPRALHCVFTNDHYLGPVQAAISPSVHGGKDNFVFHIVELKSSTQDTLRHELNIPDDATVFGRHGGAETFNIDYVRDVILEVVKVKPNIYFVFLPRPTMMDFVYHPQIKYLPTTIDAEQKRKFLNTCDAMLHCRTIGESFGISCMEFAAANKPVITHPVGWPHQNQHITNLGSKALLYHNKEELLHVLLTFNRSEAKLKDWDVTRPFTPEAVMNEFNRVFIQPCLQLQGPIRL